MDFEAFKMLNFLCIFRKFFKFLIDVVVFYAEISYNEISYRHRVSSSLLFVTRVNHNSECVSNVVLELGWEMFLKCLKFSEP